MPTALTGGSSSVQGEALIFDSLRRARKVSFQRVGMTAIRYSFRCATPSRNSARAAHLLQHGRMQMGGCGEGREVGTLVAAQMDEGQGIDSLPGRQEQRSGDPNRLMRYQQGGPSERRARRSSATSEFVVYEKSGPMFVRIWPPLVLCDPFGRRRLARLPSLERGEETSSAR